ncbi:hypothetical protein CASFOL_032542 [Castilleja foliolosa]|uniref:Nudix hydrolase domain-containing protein n=1 Tax=Castilleja foliolosa TaxID=1961234 RepID=A0ABD3C3J3_9LAMI
MADLVARTGRHQQRYEDGYRLIAGCIPFRCINVNEDGDGTSEKIVEVLMINSTGGPGLLFPKWYPSNISNLLYKLNFTLCYCVDGPENNKIKLCWMFSGGWENDETVEEAAEREAMEEAGVRGDLVHFLGCYPFKSKTLQDEYSPEGLCKAAMYALQVKEELEAWPEKSHRKRSWLTIPEAIERCRHAWMREGLEKGFSDWYGDGMIRTLPRKGINN